MASTPKFRYIGVTDECTTCENCGKPQLKSTVIVGLLDADGNTEDVVYYGSTCAARALAIKGGGRSVLQSARWAVDKLRNEVAEARQRLALYGVPATGELTRREWMPIRMAFVANATRSWPEWRKNLPYTHPDFLGPEYWQAALEECVTRWRRAVADAELVGL